MSTNTFVVLCAVLPLIVVGLRNLAVFYAISEQGSWLCCYVSHNPPAPMVARLKKLLVCSVNIY
jgi:hypothetical protein